MYVFLRRAPFLRLGLETKHLQGLQESLGRATRITWDRALLRGLREARRLLTQGLAFNENSAFLLLELLKCEASAADFFRERVILRRQQASAEPAVETSSSRKDGSAIRSQQTDRDDAIAFLSELTEDIDFIVEGGAVKLVAEQFLTLPDIDSETLSSALQVIRSIANLVGKDLIAKISSRLDELKEQEEAEQNRAKQQQEEQLESLIDGFCLPPFFVSGRNDPEFVPHVSAVDKKAMRVNATVVFIIDSHCCRSLSKKVRRGLTREYLISQQVIICGRGCLVDTPA
ncbi:unnamed protein product [Dibothriocephalus latus]|uniref:Uncharacterized protein n=1 Tax=Dibothriocephalus latus TaxID=60516 RepID=A0A3P7LZ95_DIBLA|nr:unnamed protein product [Dibothriocephalus latus]